MSYQWLDVPNKQLINMANNHASTPQDLTWWSFRLGGSRFWSLTLGGGNNVNQWDPFQSTAIRTVSFLPGILGTPTGITNTRRHLVVVSQASSPALSDFWSIHDPHNGMARVSLVITGNATPTLHQCCYMRKRLWVLVRQEGQRRINCYDLSSGTLIKAVILKLNRPYQGVDHDGTYLYTIIRDNIDHPGGTIEVYDPNNGQLVQRFGNPVGAGTWGGGLSFAGRYHLVHTQAGA